MCSCFSLQHQDEAPSYKENTPTLLTCTAVTCVVHLITLPSHHQHNPQSSAHKRSCVRGGEKNLLWTMAVFCKQHRWWCEETGDLDQLPLMSRPANPPRFVIISVFLYRHVAVNVSIYICGVNVSMEPPAAHYSEQENPLRPCGRLHISAVRKDAFKSSRWCLCSCTR